MPILQKLYSYLLLWSIGAGLFACESTQKKDASIAGSSVQIKGKFQSPQKGWVVLRKVAQEKNEIIDSAEIQGQEFVLQVQVPEPDFYLLSISHKQDIPLVLNHENITISLDTRQAQLSYQVEGSQDTRYYEQLEEIYQAYSSQVEALRKENVDNPEEEMMNIQTAYLKIQQESVQKVKKFIDQMKPSIVMVRAASLLDRQEEIEYLNQLSERLNKELPNSIYTKQFNQELLAVNQQLEATKHLAIGKPAPEIALENPQGKLVKLSSLKGKLVLIDFWASWCKPCRMENPNVVKLYEKYKNKGFEIYGVSLDQDRESWLKAIADDKLPWMHVSDLKFWYSEAAQTYHVQAIPATYLVNADGMIVDKNLRGPALEQKVAELLK
ncbi:MAG: TlpA disulfide reductase family protein [Microscillaceae bacterium]|nr:TlpA disulfide reductase family protein [Microscillaceae bacterium]